MRTSSMLLTSFAILVLTACLPQTTDENAAEVYAKVYCSKHRACDTQTWDEFDNDKDECRDSLAAGFELVKDGFDLIGFDINHDELRNCLKDTQSATCEAFESGDVGNDCDDIFEF